ncbi:HEAT repeat domain-containing protein [uncultured Desulfosarcina sp.]|uniref:HEAT repeat domain-containing protein n=1 Tax=uncultured Desulfosarcina sp. TaxID=218289 RepID=UPI0029C7817B|nr:HEAT repeat domain-containing protein [uncultured Desulfosarcina sp.]
MKRRLFAPAVLLIGLLSAQVVATAHVYLSNLGLLQTTETVMRAGYLAVPNAFVAQKLDSLATAMAGGLFFTLSIGAGLSLVTLAAVWLWDRAFQRRLKATFFYLLVWACGLILANANGWNLVATTYTVVVPLVTAVAAVQLLPPKTTLFSPLGVLWPVSAAIVLALLWGMVMDRHMFTNIRDHLLLGNRAGQAVTAAYYAYTLFPAEAFKSLEQKQIRTCVLDSSLPPALGPQLEKTLRSHDYLPVAAGHPADLTLAQDSQSMQLELISGHRTVLRVSEKELLTRPDEVLTRYSQKLDRDGMFRKLTLTCLLLGFPLVLFAFFFSALSCLPDLFMTVNLSNVIAAGVCVLVGVILLVPVYQGHSAPPAGTAAATAFSAASANVRIAALRQACDDRRDVFRQVQAQGLEKSPHVAVRYWLARSLAYAKHPNAHAMLLDLADDPVPVVACQALWAMGQRKDRQAIPEIIERIDTSSHWYIQMYAYRALRTLGWVQPESPQLSY